MTYQLLHDLISNPSEDRIARILAKGGFLLPDPPSYDAATHHAPVWNTAPMTNAAENWIVAALTSEELAALAAAADLAEKKENFAGGTVATLRSWAADAENAVAAWDGWTTAQRFAALKTLANRFGTLCSRMADLAEVLKLNQ